MRLLGGCGVCVGGLAVVQVLCLGVLVFVREFQSLFSCFVREFVWEFVRWFC